MEAIYLFLVMAILILAGLYSRYRDKVKGDLILPDDADKRSSNPINENTSNEQIIPAKNESISDKELVGINGWLIIPAMGLVFAPIKSITMFLISFNFIQGLTPELLEDFRFILIGIIDILIVVFTIIVAVFFFKKRLLAIKAIIGLMIATIIATIIQAFLNESMFGELEIDTIKPILHSIIFSLIWIPYFLKSIRVKNTFIN